MLVTPLGSVSILAEAILLKLKLVLARHQSSIGGGKRYSSAVAFLDPLVSSGSRPNLTVLVNTVATKLVRSGSPHGIPEFRTVELGQVNASRSYYSNECQLPLS